MVQQLTEQHALVGVWSARVPQVSCVLPLLAPAPLPPVIQQMVQQRTEQRAHAGMRLVRQH